MPSHKVHAIVGKLVCGFSAKEIDELIDEKRPHDLSRISCREFFNQVSIIYKKYGEKGICYFALHHYLDKLVSIMEGRITKLHYRARSSLEERLTRLIDEVREGFFDEVSVFSVIFHDELLYIPEYEHEIRAYAYRDALIRRGYSKNTARRKVNPLFRIASEYREVIEEIKSTYPSNYEFSAFMDIVKSGIAKAHGGVLGNLNKIMCIILTEDAQIWRRNFGQDLYNKILNAINCNKI